MKNIITSLFFLSSLLILSQETKKVLFIGNDYTNTNFLPEMVEQIADSKGDSLYWQWNCPNGYTLDQHTTNPQTLGWIAAEDWDFIVFQEQGQLPALGTDIFEDEVLSSLDDLVDYARQNYECVKPVLYLTWASKQGDTENCDEYPWVCTYDGQQDSLTSRYLQMADASDAWVIPVGELWRSALEETEGLIELYQEDLHHPTVTGTYLAASAFYTAFFGEAATDGYIPDDMEITDGILAQQLAEDAILENGDQWHINPVVWADLIFDTGGLFTTITMETAFSVDSVVVDSGFNIQTWENGDVGAQIFPTDATYYFVMDIYSDCGNTTLIDSVVIETGGDFVPGLLSRPLSIYPNPVSDFIAIGGLHESDCEILITDLQGRVLHRERCNGHNEQTVIDVRNLAAGLYQLAVNGSNRPGVVKFEIIRR